MQLQTPARYLGQEGPFRTSVHNHQERQDDWQAYAHSMDIRHSVGYEMLKLLFHKFVGV